MKTRDLLEMILEAIEETEATKEKLVYLFNRVYADHLQKERARKKNDNSRADK